MTSGNLLNAQFDVINSSLYSVHIYFLCENTDWLPEFDTFYHLQSNLPVLHSPRRIQYPSPLHLNSWNFERVIIGEYTFEYRPKPPQNPVDLCNIT